MNTSDEWVEPSQLPLVTGEEPFIGTDATVGEFWRWGFGDLRMNIVRGVLSEFLVATALAIDTSRPRDPWDNYDLHYGDLTIEVKTAARWQSYRTRRPSKLVFQGLSRRRWDEETGSRRKEPEVIADIYVFAMHTCDEPTAYDPLSTDQWAYFVLSGDEVRASGLKSVSASSLEARTSRCAFTELRFEVDAVVATLRR